MKKNNKLTIEGLNLSSCKIPDGVTPRKLKVSICTKEELKFYVNKEKYPDNFNQKFYDRFQEVGEDQLILEWKLWAIEHFKLDITEDELVKEYIENYGSKD